MTSETLINDVTDTALWVAHYRAVESERPDAIFHDPLAKKLVGEKGRQIADDMSKIHRYVEWSVIFRTIVIDQFINDGIKEGVDAVINLGAGLDTRPYRMELPKDFLWVEVDYPKMIQKKIRDLRDDEPVCQLVRVEADLGDDQARRKVLAEAAPNARRVLVLTEGVLPYLSLEQVAKLAADLLNQDRFKYWVCEYFSPAIYKYLKGGERGRKMRNAPFKFFPKDYLGFFENSGWVPKDIVYYGDITKKYNRKMPLPLWVEILMKFLPQKARDEAGRRSGYVLLRKR